ncbi:MAG TPA: hypothetical protein VIG66_08540 [Noviherbaspirillum sp.]
MDNENVISLCGPFRVVDSLGRTWQVQGMRIYDEGYGMVDVYVDLDASLDSAGSAEEAGLHADAQVLAQLMTKLHQLGYEGPDFGLGDSGLQDENLIVLEAPEAFCVFAARRGWKNLAEQYAEGEQPGGEEVPLAAEPADGPDAPDALADPAARAVYAALLQRLTRS